VRSNGQKCDQIADGGIFIQLMIAARADGLFSMKAMRGFYPRSPQIDQLMPIVAETDQFSYRGNSRAKSGAGIFDGSSKRFFAAGGKNLRC
jgi:hypothetical protein